MPDFLGATLVNVAGIGPQAESIRTLEPEDSAPGRDLASSAVDLELSYLKAYYNLQVRSIDRFASPRSIDGDKNPTRINVLFTLNNPFEPWTQGTTGAPILEEDFGDVATIGKLDLIKRAVGSMRGVAGAIIRGGVAAAAIPLAAGMTPAPTRPQTITAVSIQRDVQHRETDATEQRRQYIARVKSELQYWFGMRPRELAPLLDVSYATLANIAKPGRTPRETSLRTMLRTHGITRELVRVNGLASTEAWLRSKGTQILRERGIDAFEKASSRSLFPARRAFNDPHVPTRESVDLDIDPGNIAMETGRF
jgi:hypothetical protein